MQSSKKKVSDTRVQLKLVADEATLKESKEQAVRALARDVKVQGFRPGKAPLPIVEKQLNPNTLHSEFLDRAVNQLYTLAMREHNLRPVAEPKVSIGKFVPFDTLEVEIEVDVIGEVKLPDYKKIKLPRKKVAVEAKELNEVLDQLAKREAGKQAVDRAAKDGDELWIDFVGVDAKTKEPIKGADGKDYPLLLGSNTFIPGFETNLVGSKPASEKTFTLSFPKDYGVKALQKRQVTFTVTVKKINELTEPKMDDAFAAKIGPFKSMAELKDDIKKELLSRKQTDADQQYADDLIRTIAEKSKVAIPEALIEEQFDRLESEQRQNIMYRGQTWQEYLESEGLNDETYRKKQRPIAELRVKAGLVLAEIAELEKIQVTKEELMAHLQALKSRYPDEKMQAELDKPENRRSIVSRLLTEKTVQKLMEYASSN
jgi:trigger factor